ncbi:CheR-type MCP methyltransferase [Haloterrigena salina JCM 13891]|uniref:protein-glutamate O-methyltransferase n=1 Tax=Haloterrigena salina JCM 13891 TaxID=1227488 RepID=M0C4M2_9EURY|nr:protein-glutamate O-methyltransferase CheR [Haloterrigena salina]ELZ16879.1 CheR-type MCP methyltransferase [Haloterrigena salina JCM 13891]
MTHTDDFDRLLSHIESRYGFATSYYADQYLRRRIRSRLSRNGLERDAYSSYLSLLEADDGAERTALLDTLSVNVTSFFRDTSVWDELRGVLETLQERRDRPLSAWSVPCSDGREPYSLAMLARESAGISSHRLSIRASDIDENALERARNGVYEQQRTSNLETELSYLDAYRSYLDCPDDRDEDVESYRVGSSIKRMVDFDRFDLITDSIGSTYDLVLCRNFFIYVDDRHHRTVLEKLADAIRPGGYLVIGKSESLTRNIENAFEPADRASRIYRRQ